MNFIKPPISGKKYVLTLLGLLVGTPIVLYLVSYCLIPFGSIVLFSSVFSIVILCAVIWLYLIVRNRLDTLGREKLAAFLLFIPVINIIMIIWLIFTNSKMSKGN